MQVYHGCYKTRYMVDVHDIMWLICVQTTDRASDKWLTSLNVIVLQTIKELDDMIAATECLRNRNVVSMTTQNVVSMTTHCRTCTFRRYSA